MSWLYSPMCWWGDQLSHLYLEHSQGIVSLSSSTSHCCWEVWFHYDSYFLPCASLSPLMFLGFLFHPVDPKILPQHLLQMFIHCALIEVLHMETYMLHFSLSHNASGYVSPYCFLFSLPEVPVCQILDLLDWSIIFFYFLCSSPYFLW